MSHIDEIDQRAANEPATPPLTRRSVLVGLSAASGLAGVVHTLQPTVASAASSDPVLHLLRRATFGPTPELVAEVRRVGAAAWLNAQLSPSSVPDTAMDALLKRWPRLSWPAQEVRARLLYSPAVMHDAMQAHLARGLWSKRQVLETAVDFWTNHLVVPMPIGEVYDCAHLYQRDVIRRYALGKYSDMLRASARHPAMLRILDNAESSGQFPNENYGREILELHTVGEGSFTEADVRASARALTGLSINARSGAYEYQPQRRFVGPLKVLGWSHPNGSPAAGEAVALSFLTYLARHPATAKRIATKLAVRFVSDAPPATLVTKLASVYLASDTATAPVLKALFTSPEFAASAGRKTRTPYEDALATLRVLGVGPDLSGVQGLYDLYYKLRLMGQAPMGWPAPNGYPDVAGAWAGASSTLARWTFHLGAAGGTSMRTLTRPGLRRLLPSKLPATYGAYVDALSARLFLTPLSSAQRTAVCAFLGRRPTDPLKSTDAALGTQFRNVVALLLDSPNFANR